MDRILNILFVTPLLSLILLLSSMVSTLASDNMAYYQNHAHKVSYNDLLAKAYYVIRDYEIEQGSFENVNFFEKKSLSSH